MASRCFLLSVFFLMLIAMTPFSLAELDYKDVGGLNVDVSFQLALPYFIENSFQFGKEVVFTYGPWGILLGRFTGPTFHVFSIISRVLLLTAIFFGIKLVIDRVQDAIARTSLWCGALGVMLLWFTGQGDSYFLFPAILVPFQHLGKSALLKRESDAKFPRFDRPLWLFLTILTSFLALAKFNIFIAAAFGHMLILLADIRNKRWPSLPIIYVISLICAWSLAGQNVLNLPLWVYRSVDLSRGYADAMSKGFFDPYNLWVVAAYYLATAMMLIIGASAILAQKTGFDGLAAFMLASLLCVMAVKHGLGGNQIEQSLGEMAVVGWCWSTFVALSWKENAALGPVRRLKIGAALGIPLVLALYSFVAFETHFPIQSLRSSFVASFDKLAVLFRSPQDAFMDGWDVALTNAHKFWLPPEKFTGQTIDVYPQQTGLVMGRTDVRYSPRPAFLSLNAHTYLMALINAAHLQGSESPDLALFQILPAEQRINDRHPASADGPSWPLLLSNYKEVDFSQNFALLKKLSTPHTIISKKIASSRIKFGELIQLPTDKSTNNKIWLRVKFKRTLFGAAIDTLYKSPHIMIENHMDDGTTKSFQIVPELGEAGFLVSPLVMDTADFVALEKNKQYDHLVQSIAFSSPDAPAHFWERNFEVEISALEISD